MCLGKNIDKKADNSAARLFGNNTKTSPIMNNNVTASGALSVTQVDNKCSVNLFKKVSTVKLVNLAWAIISSNLPVLNHIPVVGQQIFLVCP